jgi:hypothetical protein
LLELLNASLPKANRIDGWPESVRFPDTAVRGVVNPDTDDRPAATSGVARQCRQLVEFNRLAGLLAAAGRAWHTLCHG